MKTIPRDESLEYLFDYRVSPKLRVALGESFAMQTWDASAGEVRSEADADRPDTLAVPVQAELEEVGEDEIRERGAVALQLFGIFDNVQPLFSRFLGLNVADDAIRTVPEAEIRVPALGGLGKRGDVYVRSPGGDGHFLQHIRQRWVETLLPGVALPGHVGEILQIL